MITVDQAIALLNQDLLDCAAEGMTAEDAADNPGYVLLNEVRRLRTSYAILREQFEHECAGGDELCVALGVQRTEGGSLNVPKMLSVIKNKDDELNKKRSEIALMQALIDGFRSNNNQRTEFCCGAPEYEALVKENAYLRVVYDRARSAFDNTIFSSGFDDLYAAIKAVKLRDSGLVDETPIHPDCAVSCQQPAYCNGRENCQLQQHAPAVAAPDQEWLGEGAIRAEFEMWLSAQNLPSKRKGDSYGSTYSAWCWQAYFHAANTFAALRNSAKPAAETPRGLAACAESGYDPYDRSVM